MSVIKMSHNFNNINENPPNLFSVYCWESANLLWYFVFFFKKKHLRTTVKRIFSVCRMCTLIPIILWKTYYVYSVYAKRALNPCIFPAYFWICCKFLNLISIQCIIWRVQQKTICHIYTFSCGKFNKFWG